MFSKIQALAIHIGPDLLRRWVQFIVIFLLSGCAIGLFLCGVLRIQQKAQQSECKNRLRRMGVALHGYYDAYDFFPYGTLQNATLPPDKRLSWIVSTMYFFEGGFHLFDQIRLDKAWDDSANRAIADLSFQRLLVCPSASNQVPTESPLTTYVGLSGIGEDAAGLKQDDTRVGVFGYNRKTKKEDISDGLNFTAIVAETALANGRWIAGGTSTVRGLNVDFFPYLGHNRQFGGLHAGGANVLFVDGSIHFIDNTISPSILEAICTIHRGEHVSLGIK